MKNTNITLLDFDQVFNCAKRLKVFELCGSFANISDFASLLGGETSDYIDLNGNIKKVGWYYLKTSDGCGDVIAVDECGEDTDVYADSSFGGVRPVMPYANLNDFSNNFQINTNGTLQIEYGEYPQYTVDEELKSKLNVEYNLKRLIKTGKTYTVKYNGVKPIEYDEYEYNGKKYIRVMANPYDNNTELNDGTFVNFNDFVWIEVSPITWYVDEDSKLLICKNLIASGVRFCDEGKYHDNFEETEMYTFLNKYFAKDIIPSTIKELTEEEKLEKEKRKNPYNFTLDNVSEEEIISGSIESDIPVFLHGPSSEGKSARVLDIDNDATIIYLANENPDTINGKSVYNEKNNEMIDIKPSWLVKLEEKCKDGKLHILFFDEITNAFPRVQGIVFNIILNKEVNGKWKLPDNARIVAAGNEMEDSLSANELSEPLFNRFSHVYIKTTTESWLKWASTHNIHPAIYSFIAYKNGSVLRSKYDGKKVNADPRKWEMASKMLYKTNNPAMLRSLVGEDITKEFLAFCSSRVITLEDVLNDTYTNEDIESLNTAEKYATVMGLAMVDENNIRKVREFIKNMNSELLKVFDNLWANTEERLEILSEIELEKELIK